MQRSSSLLFCRRSRSRCGPGTVPDDVSARRICYVVPRFSSLASSDWICLIHQGFHYGRTLVKGDYGLLEAEIRQACNEALRYCSVGVHVRDAGQEQFPTISPREEDLLRRSALQQSGVIRIGSDLVVGQAPRRHLEESQ